MNLIEQLRALGAQMLKVISGMGRRQIIYEKYSDVEKFSVNTHVWFWRNNVTLQHLLLRATLALTRPTPADVGPVVQKWRSTSPTANFVTRCFMQCVVEKRSSVTISEVEVETERMTGVGVSRDTVAKILDDGVGLGLLEQVGNNSAYKYVGTELYWEECLDRAVYKYLQPEVREFAEAATTIHKMHDMAKTTRTRERDGFQWFDPQLSLQENLNRGIYEKAANLLDNLDESDLADLIEQLQGKTDTKK
tara:strand:- start:113 stop:859 length:747 start_codon:yes stop_codon:yes gene_type:complete